MTKSNRGTRKRECPPCFDTMTPKQIVEELDRYIVGQTKAKRALALAFRDRLRRKRLTEDMAEEVRPPAG